VSCRRVAVLTHGRTGETAAALAALRAAATRHGVSLFFGAEEAGKHGLQAAEGIAVDAPLGQQADLCVVLGGDGSILTALRAYAGTGVPVFAVNFGEVGFLATVEPDSLDGAFERAFAGDFETLDLPAITLACEGRDWTAINDVSVHRRAGARVADLAYALAGEEVGRVRCDGLVVCTPAGSTGYNLANGGPVLAWGVEGFAVSFIAPHSLTARALVAAPGDVLTLRNSSREEPVEVHVDGRPRGALQAGESIDVHYRPGCATLAQLPDATFYRRLRQKFGRLSS